MRLPLLTLAALAVLAPRTGRGEDAVEPKGRTEAAVSQRERPSKDEAVAEQPPRREMTEAAAIEHLATVNAEEREARRAGLPLPEESIRGRAQAMAALEEHRAAREAERAPVPPIGLALGSGFPDFATASLVYRPASHVRLSGGPAWNYVGWGVQGGVTLVPWSFWIAPLVSVEAGRFFRTNLGFLAKDSGGVPQEMKPLLEKIDFSYAALDVGLELGNQRGFSASIRLGLSYVSIAAHGTVTHTGDDGTVVSMSNPVLHGTLPSLKLGFQYWL